MIRKGKLGSLVLLLLLLFGSTAWGAEQEKAILTLPETVSIQGSELLLGDIAEITGPPDLVERLAQVNAGTAPRPGSSRRLTKAQIEIRLRQAGVNLSQVEFQGAQAVQIVGAVGSPVLNSSGQPSSLAVHEVVVAARDLQRGEILTAADLQVELREIRGSWSESRGLEDFVGLRTTRLVQAGTPLTDLHVEVVPLVERGAAVTIVVRTGNVTVTAPGIARQSGGLGETIEVENTLSRQRVSGRIIDAQTVEVQMKGAGMP